MQILSTQNQDLQLLDSILKKTQEKAIKHSFRIKIPKSIALKKKQQYLRKVKNMRQNNLKIFQQMKEQQFKTKSNYKDVPQNLFRRKVPYNYQMILNSYDNFFSQNQGKGNTKEDKKVFKSKNRSFSYKLQPPPKLPFNYKNDLQVIEFNDLYFKQDGQQNNVYVQVLYKSKGIITCLKPMNIMEQKMLNLKSQNIIQIHGKTQVYGKNYLVISQLINMDIKSLIKQFGTLEQEVISKFIKQLIKIIHQIHLRKCSHNNICLENVYHDLNGKIMIDISDIKVPQNVSNRQSTYQTVKINTNSNVSLESLYKSQCSFSGQKSRHIFQDDKTFGLFINYYHPPEFLIEKQSQQSVKSINIFSSINKINSQFIQSLQKGMKKDIWQIGVLCLQMMFGSINKHSIMHPYNFGEKQFKQANLSIKQKTMIQLINTTFEQIDESFESSRHEQQKIQKKIPSIQFIQFISKCLTLDPNHRPNIEQLSKLSFVQ